MNNEWINLSQLTVFIGTYEEVLAVVPDHEDTPRTEGLLAQHSQCDEIMALLIEKYGDDGLRVLLDLDGADLLLVLSEEGELVEAVFHQKWDASDLEDYGLEDFGDFDVGDSFLSVDAGSPDVLYESYAAMCTRLSNSR